MKTVQNSTFTINITHLMTFTTNITIKHLMEIIVGILVGGF